MFKFKLTLWIAVSAVLIFLLDGKLENLGLHVKYRPQPSQEPYFNTTYTKKKQDIRAQKFDEASERKEGQLEVQQQGIKTQME